jgi:hypothetical protein
MVDVADSNAVYYYHFDGLGSATALSDVNNVIVFSCPEHKAEQKTPVFSACTCERQGNAGTGVPSVPKKSAFLTVSLFIRLV